MLVPTVNGWTAAWNSLGLIPLASNAARYVSVSAFWCMRSL